MSEEKIKINDNRKKTNLGLIIGVAAPIIIYIAFYLPFFATLLTLLEHRFYDFKINIGAVRNFTPVTKNIAVIKIDDESFANLDMKWPWNRRIYARLIDILSRAGAKVIAFDVFFSESSMNSEDSMQDEALAEAINNSTAAVVLAYSKSDPLIDILARSRAQKGFIENIFDADSIVRRSRLLYFNDSPAQSAALTPAPDLKPPHLPDERFEPSWNLITLKNFLGFSLNDIKINNNNFKLDFNSSVRDGGVTTIRQRSLNVNLSGGGDYLVNYGINSNYIRPVSFHKIITGDYDPRWFEGKIVLIGATVRSLHDDFATPLMLKERTTTPGVFIHAYAQATFIENAFIGDVAMPLNFIITLILCAVLALIIFERAPLNAFIISIMTAAAHLVFTTFMFYAGFNMHSVAPQLAFFLTYVLMSSYKYLKEEHEKQLIKGIFKQYVTPEVVDELLRDPGKLTLGGEKKSVTILFADIRNFTRLSEQIQPETVVELLNSYFDIMLEIVYRHGGILDKYLGDGMMVIFGAPVEDKNSTINALRCALEMQKASIDFSRARRLNNQATIDGIGIGLNTGEVVVGNIGSQKHKEYTIIGDNVNLTARIVSIALVNQVLISENTYKLLADKVEVKKQETVKLKGKSNPVNIYEIIKFI
jgi:adenylate cyclase